MRDVRARASYLADPHTAVGIAVCGHIEKVREIPNVMLATAHPAKFPDAVRRATGTLPAEPASITRLRTLPERISVLANDLEAVAGFISDRARAQGAR
jgi:threonine synthase